MKKRVKYLPADHKMCKGREDNLEEGYQRPLRLHQLIKCICIEQLNKLELKNTFCLLGFASDEGVSRNQGRAGAKEGPNAIRKALYNLPLIDGSISEDGGNVHCENNDLENAQKSFEEGVKLLHKTGRKVIGLGGGHEISWPHIKALMKSFPDKAIGILNFDAHFDIRELIDGKGHSGSGFLQARNHCEKNKKNFLYHCIGIQNLGNTEALFEKAKKWGVSYSDAYDIHEHGWKTALKPLQAFIDRSDLLYVSVCLDVFAAPFAPGVSSPQPLGLLPGQVLPLLEVIRLSNKLVGVDIAELNPSLDRDEQTAKLAAALIAALTL